MNRWVYVGLAYGLASGVLVSYLAYVLAALRRSRRQMEDLLKRPVAARDRVEDTA